MLIDRLFDWFCTRLDLRITFDGDLMTPDCADDAPDPHYRPPYMTTPRQHVARLEARKR